MIKKYFNRETLKEKHFKNSTKCRICNNEYFDGNVKVRDHCHFTGKYCSSAHRDRNTNVKLNHKIPVVFHNLKIMIPILLCRS